MKLTPEDQSRLRDKELANIIRKLNSGKTLTAREEAKLAAATGAGESQSGNAEPGFARNWDELATALGIDERSLYNFRQRHAKRIKELGRALTRADGRHCVAEWRRLGDEFGELKGKGINNPDADYIDERALRLRERQFAVAKAEHKLAEQIRAVLPLTEYQAALRLTVGQFEAALNQLPGRCADQLALRARHLLAVILRSLLTPRQFEKLEPSLQSVSIDTGAILEILDVEIDAIRAHLARADFLESPAPPD